MKGKKQDIHELIRIEAYLLSEKAGHPAHMSDYFWTQAEAIVRRRAAVVAKAMKASGKQTGKASTSAKRKPGAAKLKKSSAPRPVVKADPTPVSPPARKPQKVAPAKKAVAKKPAPKSS